jgi:hypothetical protein
MVNVARWEPLTILPYPTELGISPFQLDFRLNILGKVFTPKNLKWEAQRAPRDPPQSSHITYPQKGFLGRKLMVGQIPMMTKGTLMEVLPPTQTSFNE